MRNHKERDYKKGREGKGMDKNFLQGKYHYLMSSQTYECPLFCKCSLLALKESAKKRNNKSVLSVVFFLKTHVPM